MGLFGPGNKGLGVAVADITADGLVDFYVANDIEVNFLFVNQRGVRLHSYDGDTSLILRLYTNRSVALF